MRPVLDGHVHEGRDVRKLEAGVAEDVDTALPVEVGVHLTLPRVQRGHLFVGQSELGLQALREEPGLRAPFGLPVAVERFSPELVPVPDEAGEVEAADGDGPEAPGARGVIEEGALVRRPDEDALAGEVRLHPFVGQADAIDLGGEEGLDRLHVLLPGGGQLAELVNPGPAQGQVGVFVADGEGRVLVPGAPKDLGEGALAAPLGAAEDEHGVHLRRGGHDPRHGAHHPGRPDGAVQVTVPGAEVAGEEAVEAFDAIPRREGLEVGADGVVRVEAGDVAGGLEGDVPPDVQAPMRSQLHAEGVGAVVCEGLRGGAPDGRAPEDDVAEGAEGEPAGKARVILEDEADVVQHGLGRPNDVAIPAQRGAGIVQLVPDAFDGANDLGEAGLRGVVHAVSWGFSRPLAMPLAMAVSASLGGRPQAMAAATSARW